MTLVQVDGRTVEYLSAGQGEPILLCSPDWWPLAAWTLSGIPELSDRYQVVAFNQRGIGQSSGTPDDYTVPLFARDTLALMDALGLPSAHLLGFAIGAVIAMDAARQAPGRVRSLVLAAAGAGVPPGTPRVVPAAVEREIAERGYRAHIREHALNDDFAFNPENFRVHPERAEALADALWEHAGTEAEFRKHVLARQGYVTTENLAAIATPALVICGEEDTVARGTSTPVGVARELAAGLPNAWLVLVPRTRHMLFWESPEACWTAVRDFLAACG
ncbi:MAG TPA: alpha/beta hydrolase [Chloroflexota bacterium]|jgi:pimeloyl-ACP methyl ester carboxylesterase